VKFGVVVAEFTNARDSAGSCRDAMACRRGCCEPAASRLRDDKDEEGERTKKKKTKKNRGHVETTSVIGWELGMSTKLQEQLDVRRVSAERRGREIAAAVVDRCASARKSSSFNPVLSPRLSDVGARGRGKFLSANEAKSPIDLAACNFPVPSEASLKSLFDLTPAEARLAQHLACGDSVEEVAQTLHIKMTTARTQLAAIFAKTETRRQAKLVAILSRVAHLERAMLPTDMSTTANPAETFSPIGDANLTV
jgi:DNA-binding CsgD family transcriptional regulator